MSHSSSKLAGATRRGGTVFPGHSNGLHLVERAGWGVCSYLCTVGGGGVVATGVAINCKLTMKGSTEVNGPMASGCSCSACACACTEHRDPCNS